MSLLQELRNTGGSSRSRKGGLGSRASEVHGVWPTLIGDLIRLVQKGGLWLNMLGNTALSKIKGRVSALAKSICIQSLDFSFTYRVILVKLINPRDSLPVKSMYSVE